MSAEDNKALVRRYVEELVDRSNFDLSEEIFAPDFIRYDDGPDKVSRVEDLKHFFAMLHSGFPGFQSTIVDLLSEGDKVALRFTFHGTHQSEFIGIVPTGKEVTMSGIDILRIADGKIVELWNEENVLSMMQQLGVIPASGHSEEASPPSTVVIHPMTQQKQEFSEDHIHDPAYKE